MITYNDNPYLSWERSECYKYKFTNVEATGQQISWTLEGEGSTLSGTLNAGASAEVTLDGDGIYKLSITIGDQAEVQSGYLIELCSIFTCVLKQYVQLYGEDCKDGQLVIDPCDDCQGATERIAGLVRHYGTIAGNTLTQMSMLLIFYLAAVAELHLKYTAVEISQDEKDELVGHVYAMWEGLKAFSESCGFECDENSKCQEC